VPAAASACGNAVLSAAIAATVPGGKEEDRGLVPAADLRQHRPAVHSGQAHVEDDEVVLGAGRVAHRVRAGADPVDQEAVLAQAFHQVLARVDLVLRQQQSHHAFSIGAGIVPNRIPHGINMTAL